MANKSAIFLWENTKEGGAVWWKIFPPDGVLLPDLESSREAVIDAKFYMHPVSVYNVHVHVCVHFVLFLP